MVKFLTDRRVVLKNMASRLSVCFPFRPVGNLPSLASSAMKREKSSPRGSFWGVGAPKDDDGSSWRRTEPVEESRLTSGSDSQRALQEVQARQSWRRSSPEAVEKSVKNEAVREEPGSRKGSIEQEPPVPEKGGAGGGSEGLSELEKTFLTVTVPPTEVDVPPRVEHIISHKEARVSEVVSECLELPVWFVTELIRFGAVYSCPVHPLPPDSMSPTVEQLERLKRIRRESMKTFGRHANHQQPRRLTSDCVITQNSYVRVHVHPKRFPAFYRYNWSERIIWDGQGCVVVNKPPGCQVCSRVDNSLESVCAWVTAELELQDELMTTHRLDMGTEGVVVLAKTREFASYFNRTICKKDRVKKVYRALSEKPPAVGRLIHYMMVGQRGPGEPAHTVICEGDQPASLYAELVVLKVEKVQLTGEALSSWGEEAYEALIELKTGRTHQIRAQLAAVGSPLLGDNLYRAVSQNGNNRGDVCPDNPSASRENEAGEPKLSYTAGQCDCIGLQAFRLEIHDSRAPEFFGRGAPRAFEAGTPWWRSGG